MIKLLQLLKKGTRSLRTDGIILTLKRVLVECFYFLARQTGRDSIAYQSRYQDNCSFSGQTTDVKPLAFYLPQFHTIPENDAWWGKGFTEWTNLVKGEPKFPGHYQPRLPHPNIGYYDLTDFHVLRSQAELARQHGIYGFCFYYYWFSGKRLLEKPVDLLLSHREIEMPFCLCWANENWTRTWDGNNSNVLIRQNYSDSDPELFIADLKKYVMDPRYIRIDEKPLILVYNLQQIPNAFQLFSRWKSAALEEGIGDITIWICRFRNTAVAVSALGDLIDGEVEFPPHAFFTRETSFGKYDFTQYRAGLFDYRSIVDSAIASCQKSPEVKLHKTCMMAWDNTSRRKDAWSATYAFSLRDFYRWVRSITEYTRKNFPPEERFFFINAWNEWTEGTYLEPDEKYGYANINTFSEALFDNPSSSLRKELRRHSFRSDWRLSSPLNPMEEEGIIPRVQIVAGNPSQIHVGAYTYGAIEAYMFHDDVELRIGSFCSIAPGVKFVPAGDHYTDHISSYPFISKIIRPGENEAVSKGSILVDDDVWIGCNAVILSGVHIGQGAVVAAGAVVSKDVPPYAIVGGIPAKVLRYRFSDEIIQELLKIDYSKLTDSMIIQHEKELYETLSDPARLSWLPKKENADKPVNVIEGERNV